VILRLHILLFWAIVPGEHLILFTLFRQCVIEIVGPYQSWLYIDVVCKWNSMMYIDGVVPLLSMCRCQPILVRLEGAAARVPSWLNNFRTSNLKRGSMWELYVADYNYICSVVYNTLIDPNKSLLFLLYFSNHMYHTDLLEYISYVGHPHHRHGQSHQILSCLRPP
jgi:hypothetical protein